MRAGSPAFVDRAALAAALAKAYPNAQVAETFCAQEGIPSIDINRSVDPREMWLQILSRFPGRAEPLARRACQDRKVERYHDEIRGCIAERRSVLPGPAAYLRCDRTSIWKDLASRTRNPNVHTLLLCGGPDDAHDYFFRRVHSSKEELGAEVIDLDGAILKKPDPERAILDLRDRIALRRVELPALADPAADVPKLSPLDELADWVARLLADRSLIVIYPSATAREHADWLQRHHLVAVPALFQRAKERFAALFPDRSGLACALITLQPIVWAPQGLWDRMRRGAAHASSHKSLLPASPPARVVLHDLEPIAPEHVLQLFTDLYPGQADLIEAGSREGIAILQSSGGNLFSFFDELQPVIDDIEARR